MISHFGFGVLPAVGSSICSAKMYHKKPLKNKENSITTVSTLNHNK